MGSLSFEWGYNLNEWTIGVTIINDKWSKGFVVHLLCTSLIVEW